MHDMHIHCTRRVSACAPAACCLNDSLQLLPLTPGQAGSRDVKPSGPAGLPLNLRHLRLAPGATKCLFLGRLNMYLPRL